MLQKQTEEMQKATVSKGCRDLSPSTLPLVHSPNYIKVKCNGIGKCLCVLPRWKHQSDCHTAEAKVVFLLLSEVLCVTTRGPKFCVEEIPTSPATPS